MDISGVVVKKGKIVRMSDLVIWLSNQTKQHEANKRKVIIIRSYIYNIYIYVEPYRKTKVGRMLAR